MILSYCFSNFQTFCIISLILSKNPDSIYVISYHARGFLSEFFVFFYSIITYDQGVKRWLAICQSKNLKPPFATLILLALAFLSIFIITDPM